MFADLDAVKPVKIAACQVPEIRENPEAALDSILRFSEQASNDGASLVCFPECFLQGYLTEERAARRHGLDLNSSAFAEVLEHLAPLAPMLVLGLIETDVGALFNTAVVVKRGRLVGRYRKSHLLPGEHLFEAGRSWPIFNIDGLTFGINICFDTAIPEPASAVAQAGAKLIVCPANNMMKRENAEAWKDRHNEIRARRARENGVWLLSSDVTGESEGRVALGPTALIDPTGRVVSQVPLSEVGMVIAEVY